VTWKVRPWCGLRKELWKTRKPKPSYLNDSSGRQVGQVVQIFLSLEVVLATDMEQSLNKISTLAN
jgi:hypothetical protein